MKTFIETHRIKSCNRDTAIYALLGNPVSQSVGHIFHNNKFNEKKLNARYVKIQLCNDELKIFFELIKELPFKGFSVTMPLKKEVVEYLDSASFKAINTLRVRGHRLEGINTDGKGAIEAISQGDSTQNKSLLLLGAGGAASAIAHEASKSFKNIFIVNRTYETAITLAKETNATALSENNFQTTLLCLNPPNNLMSSEKGERY